MHYHTFCVEVAEKIGVEKAIILQNIYFWNCKNLANDKLEEGLPYTYNTAKAFKKFFPYYSEHQIYRFLKSLEDDGYLLTGNFNSSQYDRTKWYCVTDLFLELIGEKAEWNKQNCENHFVNLQNENCKNVKSNSQNRENNITDINTDINTDNKNIYNKAKKTENSYFSKNDKLNEKIDQKIKNNEYAFQVFEKLQKNKILCSKDFTQFVMRDWRIALPIIHNHGLHSDDVLQAIENYGEVLALGNITWWNVKQPFYTWCEKNILRFIPSIFSKDDFLNKNKKEVAPDVDKLSGQKKIKLEYTK